MDMLLNMKISKIFLIDLQVLPKDTSNKQLKRDVSLRRIGRNGSTLLKQDLIPREQRIEKGKQLIEDKYRVLRNETGRGGRYVVERKMFEEKEDF